MAELARVLPDNDGEGDPVSLVLTQGRNQVLFRHDNLEVTSRLVEGNYVDINRVIPGDWSSRTVVSTAELMKAVRMASIFAKDSANIVRVQVDAGGDMLPGVITVSANAAEVGDNVSQLDCMVDGEGGQVALNGKFLVDVLGVMKTSQVAIETKSYQSPAVLKPVGEDEFLHVIMPMYLPNR